MQFLRHLAVRLSGRAWAVKGGVCLRFFHGSPRLSEDIDLDAASRLPVKTLQNAVDSVLKSRAFSVALLGAGVARLTIARSKQTETTQRWKIGLMLSGSVGFPTKIEISRRGRIEAGSGVPRAEVLAAHGAAPFAAQFYGANEMAVQKILALASSRRTAARDLFDLHHLFFMSRARPQESAEGAAREEVEGAMEKAEMFSFVDFKEQVLPYLAGDVMPHFRDAKVYEALRSDVIGSLERMRG